MKFEAGKIGRPLWLATGVLLCALGLLGIALKSDLDARLSAALVLGTGAAVLLLGYILEKMSLFVSLLRHVQYLTQSSEYTARLLREITEVMRAIQAAEAQEQKPGGNPGKKPAAKPDPAEEMEFEKAVRQFEQ